MFSPLRKCVEPALGQGVVIETCIAHAALADDGVFGGALVRAVQCGRDNCVLFIGDLGLRRFPHVVIGRQVRADGDVIPGHKPEAGHVDGLVVVPQAAAIPSRVVGRAA